MEFKLQVCLFFIVYVFSVLGYPYSDKIELHQGYKFHSRQAWGSAASNDTRPLTHPAPVVVIHHTYIPGECHDEAQCMKDMRSMQKYHMSLGWGDIGYNFCVGGEGGVYEGRGWKYIGIHAGNANSYSIGICLIGDFRKKLPTPQQLQATKALILNGVNQDFISPSYRLIGHDQVRPTECPGVELKKEISTWHNYDPKDYKNNKDPLNH